MHEGHMGHYHHWRTDDSSSSCFCAILNVGKMRGVTPTDAIESSFKGAPVGCSYWQTILIKKLGTWWTRRISSSSLWETFLLRLRGSTLKTHPTQSVPHVSRETPAEPAFGNSGLLEVGTLGVGTSWHASSFTKLKACRPISDSSRTFYSSCIR